MAWFVPEARHVAAILTRDDGPCSGGRNRGGNAELAARVPARSEEPLVGSHDCPTGVVLCSRVPSIIAWDPEAGLKVHWPWRIVSWWTVVIDSDPEMTFGLGRRRISFWVDACGSSTHKPVECW